MNLETEASKRLWYQALVRNKVIYQGQQEVPVIRFQSNEVDIRLDDHLRNYVAKHATESQYTGDEWELGL